MCNYWRLDSVLGYVTDFTSYRDPCSFKLNIRGSCCGDLSPWGQVSTLGVLQTKWICTCNSTLLCPLLILSLSLSLKFCNEMNLFRQDVGQPASIPPHPTLILLYILAEMDCSITVTGCPDWVPKPLIKTRNTFRWLINTFSQSGLCRWMCV